MARTTINDVAQRAGVSRQTVSRVLNDQLHVAPETYERIRQAIEELNYRPSAIARSMVTRRTRTLGVVSYDLAYYGPAGLVAGAEEEARESGYSVFIASIGQETQALPSAVNQLEERQVEGIFIAVPTIGDEDPKISAQTASHVPVMTLSGSRDRRLTFTFDQAIGVQQAIQHLMTLGHQRIGLITGPADWHVSQVRRWAWERTLREAGLVPQERLIAQGDWSAQSGYEAMQRLLCSSNGMTALFAQNDQMALGAMRAINEQGLRVPDDLAVIGFDDIPEAAFFNPPLTTVRQPNRELGRIAMRSLIELVEDPEVERTMAFSTELVIRESCGANLRGR